MKNYHETGTLPCLSRTREATGRIPDTSLDYFSKNKENFDVALLTGSIKY
jgi:hypothetical protein